MDGYKLPPKRPIKRRGGARASESESSVGGGKQSEPVDSMNSGSKAREKQTQYDKMMAEIQSDDSDDELVELRRYTATAGGFGRKVGEDQDLQKESDIKSFGKEKIRAGAFGSCVEDFKEGESGEEDDKGGKHRSITRNSSDKRRATMEDLHRAEFGDDHGFKRRSAARRVDDASDDEESGHDVRGSKKQGEQSDLDGVLSATEGDGDDASRTERSDKMDNKGSFSLLNKFKKGGDIDSKVPHTQEKKRSKKKKSDVLDPQSMRSWLTRPCRDGDKPLQTYIIRDKSGSRKLYPIYRVFIDDGRNEFIMMGRKRAGKATSNFLITMDKESIDRSSDLILCKLRANMTGSEYTIYDHGMSPEMSVSRECVRHELGMVFFEYDKMGPGKIKFAVPNPKTRATFQPMNETEKLITKVKDGDLSQLVMGSNKRPKWDEHAGGHVLNFHGRVTLSSVKNFQLVCDGNEEDTVLQFGRVDKDKFTMDVSYPLSPVQAFAICLSSLDKKMADSSLADGMKGLMKGKWFGKSKKYGEDSAGGKNAEHDDEQAGSGGSGRSRHTTSSKGSMRQFGSKPNGGASSDEDEAHQRSKDDTNVNNGDDGQSKDSQQKPWANIGHAY